ncbi:MAG: SGNH/GDSL hydrolase family protein [Bacteroidetes bacterium]|nr:MAG: SGNH/GDSL hydrolase family protein [Bacteroidota bacterium]
MKARLGNFFLILLGLALAALAGEGLVRLFLPQKLVPPCFKNDPEVAISGVPDCAYLDEQHPDFFKYFVRLNNLGLRMDADLLPTDSPHVVCLGDSFTYGWGVQLDQSFWGILNKTADKFGFGGQLVNAGFPAYSTGHCTKKLEQLCAEIPVKKVIYFMYFNDLFDNMNADINFRTHEVETSPDGAISLRPVPVFSAPKRWWHSIGLGDWLYKHAHLAVLARKVLRGNSGTISQRRPFYDTTLTSRDIEKMIRVSVAHLDLMARFCSEKQLDLMVVWIPCWLELTLENDYGWVNNFPYETFKSAARKSLSAYPGVRFFDPVPAMNVQLEGQKSAVSDYYFGEGHFRPKGHLLYYQSIWEEVLRFLAE